MRKKIFSLLALMLITMLLSDASGQSLKQVQLVVQTGHSANVTSVAFSPDGKTLASGSWDDTIKLWEVSSGQEIRALLGHDSYVTSVTFSPDGKTLASGSRDKTIRLWNVITGEEVRKLSGHSGFVSAVAFSRDGRTLVSASWDKTAKLWDVATGQDLLTFSGHVGYVTSAAFSPDGQTLATGGSDKTIRLWTVSNGQEFRTLSGHADEVTTLAFSPNGRIIASGSNDDTIKLWDTATGQELRTLTGHGEDVRSVAFSPDGTTIVSGSWDKTIKFWSVATGQEVHNPLDHADRVNTVAISADGKIVASSGHDNVIKLWQIANGQPLLTLTGHSSSITSVAFSPDGKTLAGSGLDRTIKLWQMSGGQDLRSLSNSSFVSAIAFSPVLGANMLASGSVDRIVRVWDLSRDLEPRTFAGHSQVVRTVAFSPDGKMLASGSDDKTIILWNVATGQKLRTLTGHSNMVRSVAFSPDSRTLASGSWDKTVRLWDVATGQELRNLSGHSNYVTAVAFTPDGETLASASSDKTIKLWQSSNGQELRTLSGHSAGVLCISFSKDGKTLASGSEDNTIKLWNLTGGQQPITFGGQWVPYSVVFSPDGTSIVSGNGGARIRLWSSTGEEKASLISLDEKDWAVVTPTGLFDASSPARKLMHYVIGLEVITLDQMKNRYYQPQLLRRLTAGEPLSNIPLFTAKDLFPEAEYQPLNPGQQKFTVKLRNRGGGIGPVQVLVNGTEFIPDARPPGTDPWAKELTLEIDVSKAKQVLPGQENKVEVIARNADSSLSSKGSARGVAQVFTGSGNATTGPPHLYAIIGGVSKYANDELTLHYSAKDAVDFARALAIGASKFLGRDHVHIRLLASDRTENNETFVIPDVRQFAPTKQFFRSAFTEFAALAKPEDILVVYLSGHGVALKKENGDDYLYLTEEAQTTDSSLLSDQGVRGATTIMSEELVKWVRDVSAMKKALVLDTCAAGLFAQSFGTRRDISPDQVRALENLKDRTGLFVLMGSAADKVSYETTRYRQGLLTYSVLEGLKGASLKNGYANVGDVFSYTQTRVPQLAHNIGAIQQPQYFQPDGGGTFDFALYTDAEQKLFCLPSPNPLILHPQLLNQSQGYDDLKLSTALQKTLTEVSFAAARNGNESSFVLVEANEMPDAFLPSGFYLVSGDKITINLNLIRNGAPLRLPPFEGSITDDQSKSELIQKVVNAVIAETQRSIRLEGETKCEPLLSRGGP
jgi:WD40 repeat protein